MTFCQNLFYPNMKGAIGYHNDDKIESSSKFDFTSISDVSTSSAKTTVVSGVTSSLINSLDMVNFFCVSKTYLYENELENSLKIF